MSNVPDLEIMEPEEAAEIIWDRMRVYMKEKGGKRATDLFKEVSNGQTLGVPCLSSRHFLSLWPC